MLWPLLLLPPAILLIALGLRGKRHGAAPHCAACSFNLTGLPVDRPAACPECGAPTSQPSAVAIGERRRRPAFLASGALMLAFAAAPLLPLLTSQPVNWTALKPDWLLLRECGSPDLRAAREPAAELLQRHLDDRLSTDALARLVDHALTHQAVAPTHVSAEPWSRLLAAAEAAGRFTPEQRTLHLAQLFPTESFDAPLLALRTTFLAPEPITAEPIIARTGAAPVAPVQRLQPTWYVWGERYGIAPVLRSAVLDGEPLPLRPAHTRPWLIRGEPNLASDHALPADPPHHSVAPFTAAPGEHTLTINWDLHIYRLAPNEPDATIPTREPDLLTSAAIEHPIRVLRTCTELFVLMTSEGAGAPPRYRGPESGARLTVTPAAPGPDGEPRYTLRASLTSESRASIADCVVLARPALRIRGTLYHAAIDPASDTRLVYDPTPGKRHEPGPRADAADTRVLFTVTGIPRAETADLLLIPDPEAAVRFNDRYPIRALWNEPITIPNLPLDWSNIP